MDNLTIKIITIEVKQEGTNKKYTFKHFSDENEVIINLIENDKFQSHLTRPLNDVYNHILSLKEGDKINNNNMNFTVIKRSIETL